MTSKSTLRHSERALTHHNALVRKLFETAEAKKSNIVVSADLTNTKDLLELADSMCAPRALPIDPLHGRD